MEIDLVMIGQILTIVLGLAVGYAGKYLIGVKSLIKELGESFTATSRAIEDGVVTAEELELVIKEWMDVLKIFKVVK